MATKTLRPHQVAAVQAVMQFARERRGRFCHVEVTVAGGKSLIAAALASAAAGTRVLIVTHRKPLVQQDMTACSELGLYAAPCCAEIGVKVFSRVTVGTIGTVINRIDAFKDVGLIIIDEAHRVPPEDESQYRKLFAGIPAALVVGLTGTAFRADGSGSLEVTFGPCVYRYTFGQALEEGFVKPLRAVETTATAFDTSGLAVSGGEWSGSLLTNRGIALAPAHAEASIAALDAEMRTRTIAFACNIAHADALAAELNKRGRRAVAAHTGRGAAINDKAVADFQKGRLPILISVGKFDTGFDVRDIDSVIFARPMRSPLLYVQALGRGARLSDLALDSIVIDFGGNIERHGPLDMVKIKRKEKKDEKEPTAENAIDEKPLGFDVDAVGEERTVGKDLSTKSRGGELVAQQVKKELRWVKLAAAPIRIPTGTWVLPTVIGNVKWLSTMLPPNPVQACVAYDARLGAIAHGVLDSNDVMHKIR